MAIQGITPYTPPAATKSGTANARAATETPADTKQTTSEQAASARAAAVQPPHPEMLKQIMEALGPVARNLHFSIDDTTGRTVVKVVDPETDEVIRQIPSEDLLELTRSMDKFVGLFVKDKA